MIKAIAISSGKIELARVSQSRLSSSDYRTVVFAPNAATVYRKNSAVKGEPHNAIASLIARRQLYGRTIIVGIDVDGAYTNVPRSYVETYTISRQEKQEEEKV